MNSAPPGVIRQGLLALLSLLLALLAACGNDDRSAPAGVVSLAPALTETVFALGLGGRLIGRSDYGQYPPAVQDLPPMGTALSPNFEAIARARPAVILTDQSGAEHLDTLGRLAEVVMLPWLTVNDVAEGMRRIGTRLGRAGEADALAERFETAFLAEPPPDAPRVLFVLEGADVNQVWYLRRNSVHGQALRAAGALNAVDRDVSGAAVLAPEQLLQVDPDAIVVLATGGSGEEARRRALERFAALDRLQAVRTGRIGAVVGARFAVPGPSSLDLVRELAAEIQRLRS